MARTAHSSTPPLRRAACALALLAACTQARAEAQGFIGALMPIAGKTPGGYCPRGWQPADGRLLPVQSYAPLFSILGNTYGGNGTSNFALPDLRGRAAVGQGAGPGLTPLGLGEQGGSASVTLSPLHLPAHSHGLAATTQAATHAAPGSGRIPAQAQNAGVYAGSGPQVQMGITSATGQPSAPVPVPTVSPSVVIYWCIATEGDFPQRN